VLLGNFTLQVLVTGFSLPRKTPMDQRSYLASSTILTHTIAPITLTLWLPLLPTLRLQVILIKAKITLPLALREKTHLPLVDLIPQKILQHFLLVVVLLPSLFTVLPHLHFSLALLAVFLSVLGLRVQSDLGPMFMLGYLQQGGAF